MSLVDVCYFDAVLFMCLVVRLCVAKCLFLFGVGVICLNVVV